MSMLKGFSEIMNCKRKG